MTEITTLDLATALRERDDAREALFAASYLIDLYRACHAGRSVRNLDEAEAAFVRRFNACRMPASATLTPKEPT